MILVDPRVGSAELVAPLRRHQVPVESSPLEFGDVAFEGHGPDGTILVGMERKKIHDMLQCIDDARYAGHQRPGMARMYGVSFLIIEGVWGVGTPPYQDGILIEPKGSVWIPLRYRTMRVIYAKLRRYLFSVALSGVYVIYTRDITHTVADIHECYQYFRKKWDDHTSLRETRKLNLPTLHRKPNLTRLWASDLEGIGVKHGEDAERLFRKPITLANADEIEWMRIRGVGAPTAQAVVRQIRGVKS